MHCISSIWSLKSRKNNPNVATPFLFREIACISCVCARKDVDRKSAPPDKNDAIE